MPTKGKLNGLIGKDLKGFKIAKMTEVYFMDLDGRKSNSVGFFKNPNIAEAFAGVQTDAAFHKTQPALVLTDGKVGYLIAEQDPIKLFDDETEALEIKKKALAKLTPAERKLILGFSD